MNQIASSNAIIYYAQRVDEANPISAVCKVFPSNAVGKASFGRDVRFFKILKSNIKSGESLEDLKRRVSIYIAWRLDFFEDYMFNGENHCISIYEQGKKNLADHFRGRSVINKMEIPIIFFDIIQSILFLHSNGVAHLDIKFENLVLFDTGDYRDHVKLVDNDCSVPIGERIIDPFHSELDSHPDLIQYFLENKDKAEKDRAVLIAKEEYDAYSFAMCLLRAASNGLLLSDELDGPKGSDERLRKLMKGEHLPRLLASIEDGPLKRVITHVLVDKYDLRKLLTSEFFMQGQSVTAFTSRLMTGISDLSNQMVYIYKYQNKNTFKHVQTHI